MSKFTPGPWRIAGGKLVYALNDAGTNNRFDALIQAAGDDCATPDELEANATLIAAAPIMHAALRHAMEFIKREYRDDRYEPEGDWLPPDARKLFNQIVDAVFKAEGKS